MLVQDLEYHLTAADLAELNATARNVADSGLPLEEASKQKFPLKNLGPKLEAIHEDLIFGRGIRVLKNVPLGHDHSMRWVLNLSFVPSPKDGVSTPG